MKTAKRKRVLIVTVVLLAGLLLGAGVFLGSQRWGEDRLTAEQIAELREKYPVCAGCPPTVNMRDPSLEEAKGTSQTFVYGKVVGDVQYFVSHSYAFYGYTLSVLDDSEGLYQPGDTVTVIANAMMEEYDPKLIDGTEAVVPVSPEEGTDRMYFSRAGFFYVTEEGYTLPAFAEPQGKECGLDGLKTEALLRELKK